MNYIIMDEEIYNKMVKSVRKNERKRILLCAIMVASCYKFAQIYKKVEKIERNLEENI